MKLQVAFDIVDLEKAVAVATELQEHIEIFEIGSLLLYRHGTEAINLFKTNFPNKTILVDAKIADRGKEAATLLIQAGADWITVLAGCGKNVVKTTCATAHELGKRVMIDLLDASSLGQSALEAKMLGADAVIFHQPTDQESQEPFMDIWDMVRGNTNLPVFLAGPFSKESAHEIISLAPAGIVLSKEIILAEKPLEELLFYKELFATK